MSAVAQLQPGSTGGTIGKTDKSISGGEEQPTPSSPERKSRKAAVNPATTVSRSISGAWVGSLNGLTYRLSQSGSSFTWVIGSETAHGTINGDQLHASWSGGFTTASANGRLAKDGLTITWDNGMVFTRN
ncbi:MAG: hypothetical protein ACLPKB_28705 [Xanthobacteraceae bacterium]